MLSAFNAECSACNATGIYQGFWEGPGEAVICALCSGTGCEVITFIPFSYRRRKRGVKTVRPSRGRLIATGVGGTGDAIPYKEWFANTTKRKRAKGK